MNKVRWGVIGAGGIADLRTIPGMMLCQNAELEAVMEVNMELAEKCRAKWNCRKAYDCLDDILADPEIDAVYIATPVFLHAQQAMAAAEAGKHILIEKPLAVTAEEAQKVVDFCKNKKVLVAAGFMMRFGTYAQMMKKYIAEGRLGNPVSGYSMFSCWYPDMPGNWRQSKKDGGGGAMMDMGVHCIDLIQYVLGMRAKEVTAFHDTITFDYEVEDTSTILMRMENGAQCVVQSNFNIPYPANKSSLEVFGDRGSMIGMDMMGQVDGGTLETRFSETPDDPDADREESISRKYPDAEFGNMYEREITSFSDSILKGTPVEVPAEDAVYVQRIMEAAYTSNDDLRAIKL